MFIPRVMCKCVRRKGRLENPINLTSSLSSYKERRRPFSVTRAQYPLSSHTLGRFLVAVTNALLKTTQTWKAYVGLGLRGCSPPWSERHCNPEQEAAGHVASTTRKRGTDQKRKWARAMNPWGPRRVSYFPSEAPLPQDSMTFQNSATSWAPGVQTQEMMGGVSFSNDKMTENFRLEKQEVLMHVTDSFLRLQVIQNRFSSLCFSIFSRLSGQKRLLLCFGSMIQTYKK